MTTILSFIVSRQRKLLLCNPQCVPLQTSVSLRWIVCITKMYAGRFTPPPPPRYRWPGTRTSAETPSADRSPSVGSGDSDGRSRSYPLQQRRIYGALGARPQSLMLFCNWTNAWTLLFICFNCVSICNILSVVSCNLLTVSIPHVMSLSKTVT